MVVARLPKSEAIANKCNEHKFERDLSSQEKWIA